MDSIDPSSFLRLPVEPSEGNYYEAGLTKVFGGKVRLDANYFQRFASNSADDDQIANTAISFPISFRKSTIYGAEAKLDLPDWRGLSGFLSYSYMVGFGSFPVTGGLFLGDDAQRLPASGRFPVSQDQRNTVRGRLRYQVRPRFWIAGGIQYDTGLPFEFQCDPSDSSRNALRPATSAIRPASLGSDKFRPWARLSLVPGQRLGWRGTIYKSDHMKMRFQIDGQNLTNVLNVMDFGGLFSGTFAIGPHAQRGWRG